MILNNKLDFNKKMDFQLLINLHHSREDCQLVKKANLVSKKSSRLNNEMEAIGNFFLNLIVFVIIKKLQEMRENEEKAI